jgi:hypothetical protein
MGLLYLIVYKIDGGRLTSKTSLFSWTNTAKRENLKNARPETV